VNISNIKNNLTDVANMLTHLIEAKTIRDNKRFTASQLAKAINVDRSLIQRLLTGEVENPRIDTLVKIVNFFTEEGFNLRVDDLIGFKNTTISTKDQLIIQSKTCSLPLYQMNNFNGERVGTASVELSSTSPGIIALITDEEIKPIFKAGSLFIVDTLKSPEHRNMVALKVKNANKVIIRQYIIEKKNKPVLISYDAGNNNIELTPESNYTLIGVITRVQAKT
jgi:transcriptional regulator with XRE-family HTH domain